MGLGVRGLRREAVAISRGRAPVGLIVAAGRGAGRRNLTYLPILEGKRG